MKAREAEVDEAAPPPTDFTGEDGGSGSDAGRSAQDVASGGPFASAQAREERLAIEGSARAPPAARRRRHQAHQTSQTMD